MKAAITLLALGLSLISCSALAQIQYSITLASRAIDAHKGGSSPVGHTFVGFHESTPSSGNQSGWVSDTYYGFYPASSSGLEAISGQAKIALENLLDYPQANFSNVVVPVTRSQYQSIKSHVSSLRSQASAGKNVTYNLAYQNCVHFVDRVAGELALKRPPTYLARLLLKVGYKWQYVPLPQFPQLYLEQLQRLNPKLASNSSPGPGMLILAATGAPSKPANRPPSITSLSVYPYSNGKLRGYVRSTDADGNVVRQEMWIEKLRSKYDRSGRFVTNSRLRGYHQGNSQTRKNYLYWQVHQLRALGVRHGDWIRLGADVIDAEGKVTKKYTSAIQYRDPASSSSSSSRLQPEVSVHGRSNRTVRAGDYSASSSDGTYFSSTRRYRTRTQSFTIRNTGKGNLVISQVRRYGNSQFSIVGLPYGNGTTVIAPGRSRTFQVRFRPTASRTYYANIQLVTNDSNEKNYAFRVMGRGY